MRFPIIAITVLVGLAYPSHANNAGTDPVAILPQAKHSMAREVYASGVFDSSASKILIDEGHDIVNGVSKSHVVVCHSIF